MEGINQCPQCTFVNPYDKDKCQMCETDLPFVRRIMCCPECQTYSEHFIHQFSNCPNCGFEKPPAEESFAKQQDRIQKIMEGDDPNCSHCVLLKIEHLNSNENHYSDIETYHYKNALYNQLGVNSQVRMAALMTFLVQNISQSDIEQALQNSLNEQKPVCHEKLSQEGANKLPVKTLDKDNEMACPICLETGKTGDKRIVFPCQHEGCEDCLKKFVTEHNSMCPICRKKISE